MLSNYTLQKKMDDTFRDIKGQMTRSPTAPTSCTACHSKKRKCDKKLPACDRCSKNRQRCCYLNLRTMSAVSPTYPNISDGSESTDESITNQVRGILEEHSTSPTHVMERYSQYIHHWLPIIDIQRKNKYIENCLMLEGADAELAGLLLCVHLATQPSSTEIRERPYMQTLYFQSQKTFASLQLTRKFSLYTIQCGLLLAVYQIGAGLLSDAYITLSTTTGMARAARILKSHHDKDAGVSSHEATAVWWAIFLLDRILALASLPENLPLLMEQPRDFEDHPRVHCLRTSSNSEAEDRPYDYFTEEVHAAFLAGRIISYINTSNGSSESDLENLNSQIITQLRNMFERAPGSWRPFCSVIAILLVTAVEVEFARLAHVTGNEEAIQSCLQGISTHLKITIDIARNYLEDQDTDFANGIVPITSVISGHRSLVAISRQRELVHATTTDYSEGSFILKKSLEKKSHLWGLADRYIQDQTGSIL